MNQTLSMDLYALTMTYGYWKLNRHNQEAAFNLFFRTAPFNGRYAIAAGLETAIKYIQDFKFQQSDLDYLATLKGNDGKPLFPDVAFFDYLRDMKITCSIKAMPEGTVVYPNEPLLNICGPIAQCQLLETPLLTTFNYQTLIATKAKRICEAANGKPVLEFGLRRAHGFDGGLSASRAAYIGGCAATSNVLAGKEFGIPVKGTMAHSWVMSFESEREAFYKYGDVMRNNITLLIDTDDTINGTFNAIEMISKMDGLDGVRLDSGDLCSLSKVVRKILDHNVKESTKIVASNDLDEYSIAELEKNGAKIDIYGVGTKLVTAYDNPALGGVYKLGAIKENGKWIHKIKHSEDSAKSTNPGLLNVMRTITYDDIVDELSEYEHPLNPWLLIPIFENGALVYTLPDINDIRQKAINAGEKKGVFGAISKRDIVLSDSLAAIRKGLLR